MASAALNGPTRVGTIRIDGVLGQGGMGTVYVGYDETLQRKVALKAIRTERLPGPAARARFLREARVLSKLEHPYICRIHGFVEEADAAYLVLEYVEGATLARHITGGKLLARHRLSLAMQIAEALAAAHAQGVVHRDLKPDNVMVTPEGDVRVLDYGLARVTTADEPHDEGEHTAAEADDLGSSQGTSQLGSFADDTEGAAFVTEAGHLLGTPLYMSPEQARGRRVTAASDMYSFGLLLQTLWSSRGPHPEGLGKLEVVVRARNAQVERAKGLPGAVDKLIGRLLQRAPAARATAVETLERLRWIEDRPARLARRAVAALLLLVAVAAGVKYTLDLRHERGIADARRGQAESLISFMLGNLRTKLTAVGRLEILDDVGEAALDYFAAVTDAELSTDELSVRAQALYQIGEVRTEQGRLEEALGAFRQSLLAGEELMSRAPGDTEALTRLGYAHFWMGSGEYDAGNMSEALAHFETSRDVARRLVNLDPSNMEWRLELAAEESNMARVYQELGDPAAAITILEQRLSTLRAILDTDPDRIEWRVELATSHLLLGHALEQADDRTRALEHYRADLDLMLDVVSRDPRNADHLERLATSRSYLGGLLANLDDMEGAREQFLAEEEIVAVLANSDGDDTGFRDHLGVGLINLARTQRAVGAYDDALATLQRCLSLYQELNLLDPDRVRFRQQLTQAHLEIGNTREQAGDGVLACESAHQVMLLTGSEWEAGSDSTPRHQFARAQLVLGRAQRTMALDDEANEAFQAAIDALIVDDDANLPLSLRAQALLGMGRHIEVQPILAELDRRSYGSEFLTAARRAALSP